MSKSRLPINTYITNEQINNTYVVKVTKIEWF